MNTYYEFQHVAGYGREDHLADELIARAARHLSMAGADDYIAASVGLASHSVPMGGAGVRLASGRGVRARMERALRAARAEFGRLVDTRVIIALVRERIEQTTEVVTRRAVFAPAREPRWAGEYLPQRTRYVAVHRRVRVREERRGREWHEVSREEVAS